MACLVAAVALVLGIAPSNAQPPVVAAAPAPVETSFTSAPCTDCCTACAPGGAAGRGWVSVDYLLWWIKDQNAVPLVTTGPVQSVGTPQAALGAPGTVILLDAADLTDRTRSGARIRAGLWLDDCQQWGAEFGYFFLASQDSDAAYTSADTPLIARPFVDITTGTPTPNSEIVSVPGLAVGSLTARGSARLQGADLDALRNLSSGCAHRLDAIVGLRYLRLDESLGATEDLTALIDVPVGGPVVFPPAAASTSATCSRRRTNSSAPRSACAASTAPAAGSPAAWRRSPSAASIRPWTSRATC